MTCKPDRAAGRLTLLLSCALAWALAGCSDMGDGASVGGQAAAGGTELELLLDEADVAIKDGALAEAGAKLDKALSLAPDSPDLWVAIARLRFRGGEHLTALDAADRALSLGPDYAPALLMRAYMVRDAHGFSAALPWFEAALAADPDNADGWAEYAATLGDDGRNRAMLEAVRKLAEAAPGDPRGAYLQAVLAARGKQYGLARSLLTRSGMAARGVPAAMVLDAVLSLEEGNPDSAAATLEALSARQPANRGLRELLARALLISGREADLVARFADEEQRAESSAYLLMALARAHERLGDRARAAPLLARAYGMVPGAPVVLADRAGLPQPTADLRRAASAASWNDAQTGAQALRSRLPQSADIAALAGDAVLGAGNPRAALSAYADATRMRRPWPLTAKAVHAYRLAGDDIAADTLLARHVAGEPDGIAGLVSLARQQAQRGEWQSAAMLLDHAIALGGGHDPALLRLRVKAANEAGDAKGAQRFAGLLAQLQPPALTTP
jgi:predicted Zn-dependent protease